MLNGVHSRAVSDALTTRQLYVERTKTALHDERDAVSGVVLTALILALSKVTAKSFGSVSRTQLRHIVSTVLAKYDIAAKAYYGRLTIWLEAYAEAEASYYTKVLNSALDEEDVSDAPVWPYVSTVIIGATGETLLATLRTLNSQQRARIAKTITRGYAQNWSPAQLINAFRGTALIGFKDGLMPKLKNAASAVVDTVVQAGMSASRLGVLRGFTDFTLGYTWVSVLDSRTSPRCRTLSGQVFKLGAGPVPPLHYRCRSHIEPIFKRSAKLRQGVASVVTFGETYYQWLARQPVGLQNEVLGTTRGKLFREGGMTTDEFATFTVNSRYEPLTLGELRRKSPTTFANAAV